MGKQEGGIGSGVNSYLNRRIVLPTSPINPLLNLNHLWKVDEAAGIAKADSIGTVHMTDYGSANVASSPIAKDGNALHATAHQTQALQNITVRTGLDTSAGRTWSIWTRPAVAVGSLILRGSFPPFAYEYVVTLASPSVGDYKIEVSWYNSVGTLFTLSYGNASLLFGSYVHLFVGFDLDLKMRLAVNGVLVATSTALTGSPRIDNVNSNLYFMGGSFGPETSIDHRQDETATWAEEFSEAKAAFMYNGGAGRFYPTF